MVDERHAFAALTFAVQIRADHHVGVAIAVHVARAVDAHPELGADLVRLDLRRGARRVHAGREARCAAVKDERCAFRVLARVVARRAHDHVVEAVAVHVARGLRRGAQKRGRLVRFDLGLEDLGDQRIDHDRIPCPRVVDDEPDRARIGQLDPRGNGTLVGVPRDELVVAERARAVVAAQLEAVARAPGRGVIEREPENQRPVSAGRTLQVEALLEAVDAVHVPLAQTERVAGDFDAVPLVADLARGDGRRVYAATEGLEANRKQRRARRRAPAVNTDARGLEVRAQVVRAVGRLQAEIGGTRPVLALGDRGAEHVLARVGRALLDAHAPLVPDIRPQSHCTNQSRNCNEPHPKPHRPALPRYTSW